MIQQTWLADVLRAEDLTVVEHDGWRTRSIPGTFAPWAVVWHHDASPPGDSPGVPAYMIRNFSKAGAQLWVDRAGVWHVVAAGRAAHAGRVRRGMPGNAESLGVETDHTTGEAWPPVQLDSLRRGTRAILRRLPGGGELHFHRTICDPPGRKIDPDGLDLTTERAALSSPTTAPPTTAPPQQPEEDEMSPQQYESLVECRRMLAVLLGAQQPATPGETRTLTQIAQTHENAGEARRMAGVLLGALPPVGSERLAAATDVNVQSLAAQLASSLGADVAEKVGQALVRGAQT